MENLLRTGFERRILWKMVNDILHIHCEGKCIFKNHLRKVDTELNSNFQLHHRYFFSKYYVTKIFCICYFIQEYFCLCFKVLSSVTVSVCILSSEGANQLQVLYVRTLEKHPRKLLARNPFLLTLGSSHLFPAIFFLEISRSFRKTSKKLILENYVLAYHTANKYAKILQTVLVIFSLFFVSYIIRNHEYTMHPSGRRLDTT